MRRLNLRLIFAVISWCFFSATGMAQDNKTLLLMENTPGIKEQTWFYSGSGNGLQKDKIKENWDKGKYITSAAYTANGWFVTMAFCPDYSEQSYNYTESWPSDWIKEKWDKDYYITSISKSENRWFIVMSKVKGYTSQAYNSGTTSKLSSWYDEKRTAGYYLTTALYADGKWYWVMTKGTNIKSQGYKWANSSNLASTIKGIWNEGSRVHFIEYGGGSYFIPFGLFNVSSQPAQAYQTSTSGISDWISKQWNDGLNLKYIGGGNPSSQSTQNYASNNSSRPTPGNNGGGNPVVRTYRETVNQYYYNEVTEYQNGNKLVANYGPCGGCGGTRRCGICHGNGGMITAGYGNFIPCSYCGQTGSCPLCRNTGGYALMSSHLYGANGKEIYVAPVGGGYSSPSTTTSGGSRNSSRSSGVCSRCGGTGVNPTGNSGGSLASWVAYYNSSGTKCPYCGSYTSHYHDRCSHCKVPR